MAKRPQRESEKRLLEEAIRILIDNLYQFCYDEKDKCFTHRFLRAEEDMFAFLYKTGYLTSADYGAKPTTKLLNATKEIKDPITGWKS